MNPDSSNAARLLREGLFADYPFFRTCSTQPQLNRQNCAGSRGTADDPPEQHYLRAAVIGAAQQCPSSLAGNVVAVVVCSHFEIAGMEIESTLDQVILE